MTPVRVALAGALVASLAACSAITSFSDLEGPGVADGDDEAPGSDSDGSGDDLSALDSSSEGQADVAPVGDETRSDASDDVVDGSDGSVETTVSDVASGDSTGIADTSSGDSAGDTAVVSDAGVVGDTGFRDSAGDGTIVSDGSVRDVASDGTLVGDAPLGDAVLDVTADGPSPSDVSIPPTDSSGPCTPDANVDPNNCGACGHSCQGGTCAAGVCGPVTLATTHGSLGIAIDSAYLYWADNAASGDAGAINKISKALTHSGTPSAVVSGTVAQGVQGVATDGIYIYWTNKSAGQVHRALPTGGALTTLATGQLTPDWIASNGGIVVWTNQGSNQVMALPVTADGGTAPTQLNVLNELGTTPAGIAIDSVAVYYATKNTGGGLAEVVPLDGGPVTELGTGTFVGITVDSNNVYWTGGSGNPIVYQNAKSGTPATQIAIATGVLTCPLAIASDGTNIYFFDQGTTVCGTPGNDAGALYRVPVGYVGSLPAPLISGLNDPQGIVVDATAIYWVTGGTSGAVMKLAK